METTREGAGYTAVNLKEVHDTAAQSEHAPNLEARDARGPLSLEHSGCEYLRLAPGFRMASGHHHDTQEEVYVVVSGSACLRIGDDVLELHAFDAVRVAPPAIRALESGPNGVEIVVFGAPREEGSDATVVADWWTDQA